MENTPRVLSIQSHVISGYVGNKSATFPLQLLGFEVDAINSVQFSNHTNYKKFAGQILNENDLDELVEALRINEIDYYTHLLTGYTRSASFLNRICTLLKHLKEINPNLIYVCDPVMGDNGKMYVPNELLPVYKSIIPLANIITPNHFELELLTDRKIDTIQDLFGAIDKLHNKGCKTIVVTSTNLCHEENYILALASQKNGNCSMEKLKVKIPKLPANFTGTGDLFTSLLLAWMYKTDNKLKESLEKTISTLQAVLERTLQYAKGNTTSSKDIELKLIQSKNNIENPTIVVTAENISI